MSGSKEKHHLGEGGRRVSALVPLGTRSSAASHHGIRAQTLGQKVPKRGKYLTCMSELPVDASMPPCHIPMDVYGHSKTTHRVPFLCNQ